MNREEAKKEIEKHYVTSVSTEDVKLIRTEVAHRVIDDVFDYFEKYENMPCEGCKWQHETGGRDYHSGVCENCFRELRDCFERKEDDKSIIVRNNRQSNIYNESE
jgi:hypothetical protein